MNYIIETGRKEMVFKQRLNYAFISFGRVLIMGFAIHLEKYYTDKVGFSPLLFGIAYLLYGIINSINDPILGGIINKAPDRRKQSKYKRLLIYAVPIMVVGAAFTLIVSPDWSLGLIFLFLFLGLAISDIGYAMHNISLSCLLLEETVDDADRAKQQGINSIFLVLAGMVIFVVPISYITDNSVSQQTAGIVLGIIILAGVVVYITATIVLKPNVEQYQSTEQKEFLPLLGRALKDRKFLFYILAAFFAGWVPVVSGTFFIYYYDNVLELEPGVITMIGAISLPLQFLMLASAGWIVKKIGIKKFFTSTTVFQIILYIGILLGLKGTGGIIVTVILSIFSQFWWIISFAILGQITDDYKLKYGEVDDALFLGIQAFLLSPALSVGRFAFFIIIDAFGYDGTLPSQSVEAIWGLQLAIGAVPAASLLIALVFMSFYFRRQKHS